VLSGWRDASFDPYGHGGKPGNPLGVGAPPPGSLTPVPGSDTMGRCIPRR